MTTKGNGKGKSKSVRVRKPAPLIPEPEAPSLAPPMVHSFDNHDQGEFDSLDKVARLVHDLYHAVESLQAQIVELQGDSS